MSTLVSSAPMRLCARGPSGTFTASTPAALQRRDVGEHARRVDAARRHDLDRRHELAARDLAAPTATARRTAPARTPWPWRGRSRRRLRVVRDPIPTLGTPLAAAATSGRMPSTIAWMCSGVVPQHPPTIFAPACTRCRAYVAMYSGLAMYMLRPPTSRGMPAFGCALSFVRVCGRHLLDGLENRLRADGAVETDDVGAPCVERARDVFRRRAVRRATVGADRHLRDDRAWSDRLSRAARIACSISCEVGERLEDEQIDAAVDAAPAICSRKIARASSRARRSVRLEANAERTDRAGDEHVVAGRLARDLRGGAIELAHLRPRARTA